MKVHTSVLTFVTAHVLYALDPYMPYILSHVRIVACHCIII